MLQKYLLTDRISLHDFLRELELETKQQFVLTVLRQGDKIFIRVDDNISGALKSTEKISIKPGLYDLSW